MSWSQPHREIPVTRSKVAWWRSTSVSMLLGAAAGGLLTYSAVAYFSGEKCGRSSVMLDPFGLLQRRGGDNDRAGRQRLPSRGESDYAEAPAQRPRLSPGSGYGSGYPASGRADGFPRDQRGQPQGRWRKCSGPPQHPRCGPWQTGPIPGEE